MKFFQSFYDNYLGVYRDHDLLNKKLAGEKTSIIKPFLRFGLGVLVVSIFTLIIGSLFALTQKEQGREHMLSYAQSILQQLPTNLTGAFVLSGDMVSFHINNDKPLPINLLPGKYYENGNGRLEEESKVMIDTSIITVPDTLGSQGLFMTQQGFGFKGTSSETKWFSFTDLQQSAEIFSGEYKTLAFNKQMIQDITSKGVVAITDHRNTIILIIGGLLLLYILLIGGFLLALLCVWYFIIQGMIWCIVTIISKILKRGETIDLRNLIATLSFLPFLIYLFFLQTWVYMVSMSIYILYILWFLSQPKK